MHVDVVNSGAFVKWQDTKPGEVYEDPKESDGLIALRLRSKQAVCLRKGSNVLLDRKSTRLNSSHVVESSMPSSA